MHRTQTILATLQKSIEKMQDLEAQGLQKRILK